MILRSFISPVCRLNNFHIGVVVNVASQAHKNRTQASRQRGGQYEHLKALLEEQKTAAQQGATLSDPLQVEIKIRLPDRAAYDKVAAALDRGQGSTASHAQTNYFFDGPNRELNSRRVVLRLRTYNGDEKATITLKGKQILENGIGRASEVEEFIEPAAGARFLAQPTGMLNEVPLIKATAEKFGLTSLVTLGAFRNQRNCYSWEGHTLELDETSFDHGILYEIECETEHPEILRDKLEAFLTQLGVSHSYSQTSKFANFINKTLL